MTQRAENIIREVDTLEDSEFQEVFYKLLQKSTQRNITDLKTIDIQNGMLYVLPFYNNAQITTQVDTNPANLFFMEAGKFQNVDFSDITEDDIYLQNNY